MTRTVTIKCPGEQGVKNYKRPGVTCLPIAADRIRIGGTEFKVTERPFTSRNDFISEPVMIPPRILQ